MHQCKTPGADQSFCLQVALKLPPYKLVSGNPPLVSGLLCCECAVGPASDEEASLLSLWASDTAGNITVWDVPYEGIDFTPLRTWQAHSASINKMTATWRHVISVGDDSKIFIYDMRTMAKLKT